MSVTADLEASNKAKEEAIENIKSKFKPAMLEVYAISVELASALSDYKGNILDIADNMPGNNGNTYPEAHAGRLEGARAGLNAMVTDLHAKLSELVTETTDPGTAAGTRMRYNTLASADQLNAITSDTDWSDGPDGKTPGYSSLFNYTTGKLDDLTRELALPDVGIKGPKGKGGMILTDTSKPAPKLEDDPSKIGFYGSHIFDDPKASGADLAPENINKQIVWSYKGYYKPGAKSGEEISTPMSKTIQPGGGSGASAYGWKKVKDVATGKSSSKGNGKICPASDYPKHYAAVKGDMYSIETAGGRDNSTLLKEKGYNSAERNLLRARHGDFVSATDYATDPSDAVYLSSYVAAVRQKCKGEGKTGSPWKAMNLLARKEYSGINWGGGAGYVLQNEDGSTKRVSAFWQTCAMGPYFNGSYAWPSAMEAIMLNSGMAPYAEHVPSLYLEGAEPKPYSFTGILRSEPGYGNVNSYISKYISASGSWWLTHWQPRIKLLMELFLKMRFQVWSILWLELQLDLAVALSDREAAELLEVAGLSDEDRKLAEDTLSINEKIRNGDLEIGSTGFNKKMIFKEQCFLLAHLFPISRQRPTVLTRLCDDTVEAADASENSLIQLNSAESYGFLNKLVKSADTSTLANITEAELSALQPSIRLYKAGVTAKGTRYVHPMEFNNNDEKFGIKQLLKDKKSRGFGAGIQSFNFTYDGSNPFAAKKSIKATLKIFANNFDELIKERSIKRTTASTKTKTHTFKYSFVDLALKTSNTDTMRLQYQRGKRCGRSAREDNLNKLNFQMRAVIGYAFPKKGKKYMKGLSSSIKDAIYNSYVTLTLTPTVHDFEFNEQGQVIMTIQYLAYIDDFYDQKAYNILNPPQGYMSVHRMIREMATADAALRCDKTFNAQSKFGDEIQKEKAVALAWHTNKLIEQDKIFYIQQDYDKIRFAMSKGPYAAETGSRALVVKSQTGVDVTIKTGIAAAAKAYAEAAKLETVDLRGYQAALSVVDPTRTQVPFFYVSDLLRIMLSGVWNTLDYNIEQFETMVNWAVAYKSQKGSHMMKDDYGREYNFYGDLEISECTREKTLSDLIRYREMFGSTRWVLGPIEIQDHSQPTITEPAKTINIGDIPVSVKYYMEFLAEKVSSKERENYPISVFINDFINNLIRNFLNDDTCFGYSVKQKTMLNQAAITSYAKEANYRGRLDELVCKNKFVNDEGDSVADINYDLDKEKGKASGPLRVSGPRDPRPVADINKEYQYMVYSAGRSSPAELMNGKRSQDDARGVYHYQIGRDKGMVKDIKLSKTDSQGLAELRFEQDGYDGLKQLRVVYDVEITTYANPKAYPGTYIYVEPKGFVPNASKKINHRLNVTEYGIGGYYMVYKSEHSFAAGQAETKMYAKWVAQLAAEADSKSGKINPHNMAAHDASSGTGDLSKCSQN
tara:strand:- start:3308 stop:7582 length:4275 start_codon:yes stop_codon:yes gene_type:complete